MRFNVLVSGKDDCIAEALGIYAPYDIIVRCGDKGNSHSLKEELVKCISNLKIPLLEDEVCLVVFGRDGKSCFRIQLYNAAFSFVPLIHQLVSELASVNTSVETYLYTDQDDIYHNHGNCQNGGSGWTDGLMCFDVKNAERFSELIGAYSSLRERSKSKGANACAADELYRGALSALGMSIDIEGAYSLGKKEAEEAHSFLRKSVDSTETLDLLAIVLMCHECIRDASIIEGMCVENGKLWMTVCEDTGYGGNYAYRFSEHTLHKLVSKIDSFFSRECKEADVIDTLKEWWEKDEDRSIKIEKCASVVTYKKKVSNDTEVSTMNLK